MNCQPTLNVLKREWMAYFQSPVAYIFIFVFLALMGVFTFSISPFFDVRNAELSQTFFYWHPWLYMVLVPAITMRVWAEERRSHTLELLLTFPVTPLQALVGKFLASWLLIGLCVLLTFPVVLTVAYLGDPDMGVVFSGYLGSLLLAGAYAAIGNFASAVTRNQVIAFVIAVVIGFFLVIAGFPPVTGFLQEMLPAGLVRLGAVDLVAALSFMTHFEQLQDGKIALRDLVYFGSVIGFMLYATLLTLRGRDSR